MAASPSSKSAAYEQGVREGSAMAKKKKAGKRSMEMEPGEGKVHEAAESPAEEAAEGPEPDDAPRARRRARPTPSRQRSAKNAANTKAPMDSSCGGKKSMDGEGSCGCGAKKGAKCSCDGEGCGSSMKRRRSDVLTAPEYLAACELGIQDRPRSYIRARLDAAERLDLKCGKGSISQGEKCHKGPASKPSALTAGAIGLGVGAAVLGVGLIASRRAPRGRIIIGSSSGGGGSSSPSASGVAPKAPRPSSPGALTAPSRASGLVVPATIRVEQPRLTGTTPRALLSPARRPKSKTQRMRENTAAAVRSAESAIGQTAREEVRRVAQIGNTMATTGEATGMAVKTGLRELRLRAEAARRRFEPGYRRNPTAAPQPPAQLPQSLDPVFEQPLAQPQPLTPERLALDPRTGQPRRRKPSGFGRPTGDNYIPLYAPVVLNKAR